MARQVTITLDDETAEKLEREARRIGAPIGEVVTQKLRSATAEAPLPREPFKVYARDLLAQPGVDFACGSRPTSASCSSHSTRPKSRPSSTPGSRHLPSR